MKKLFLYILLVAFAFRPIYFVGQVLYYQLNIDYIIDTYCINKEKPELQCNGKCHLAKQLQVVSTSTNDDESSMLHVVSESFFPVFFHTEPNLEKHIIHIHVLKVNNFNYNNCYSFDSEYQLYKPPIV